MSDERKRVEHPSWCSREECTAPEFRPTIEDYQGGNRPGTHYSATVGSGTNDLQLFLAEEVCPWETGAFLLIRDGHDGLPRSVPITESGGGFALYELLGQEVKEAVRAYPILYAERFPYVQRAIEDEADEATADAVTPRDPVELEEQMTAEQVQDEERAAKGCTHPPEEPCFGKSTAPGKAKYPLFYHLTVNSKTTPYGTLQELRAAVAELVTRRLQIDPNVAPDAQQINAAFNSGAVDEAIDERGDWFTVFDAYGEEPLRIRVTKGS